MNEEKLYVVKNDEGKYLTIEHMALRWSSQIGTAVRNINVAVTWSVKHGGHVVMLDDVPRKVVLSEKQAEIVEDAHNAKRPASYIILKSNDEELLMNAYVNGFTVARDKKYRVLAPKSWWADSDSPEYMYHDSDGISSVYVFDTDDDKVLFTQKQLEQYNLTSDLFKKEEVTDGL